MTDAIVGPLTLKNIELAKNRVGDAKVAVVSYESLVTQEFALSDLISRCADVAIITGVPWRAYALDFIRMLTATKTITCDFPGRRSEPKPVPKIIICVTSDTPLQDQSGFTTIYY